jgi:ornithine cyclodeaminase/alanine dehydrogenase-like protein (mu-crystallin family)
MTMADSTLTLALVGCGGMGLRHLHGLAELRRVGLSSFDLIAVCDTRPEAAARAADLAETLLGRRPAVCSTIDDSRRHIKHLREDIGSCASDTAHGACRRYRSR